MLWLELDIDRHGHAGVASDAIGRESWGEQVTDGNGNGCHGKGQIDRSNGKRMIVAGEVVAAGVGSAILHIFGCSWATAGSFTALVRGCVSKVTLIGAVQDSEYSELYVFYRDPPSSPGVMYGMGIGL